MFSNVEVVQKLAQHSIWCLLSTEPSRARRLASHSSKNQQNAGSNVHGALPVKRGVKMNKFIISHGPKCGFRKLLRVLANWFVSETMFSWLWIISDCMIFLVFIVFASEFPNLQILAWMYQFSFSSSLWRRGNSNEPMAMHSELIHSQIPRSMRWLQKCL